MKLNTLYTFKTKRDLRIDLLRGFCLFVMAINHANIESWFFTITGRSQFLISAAEGFFFLSGITWGLINRKSDYEQTIRRSFDRITNLYLSMIAFAFFMAILNHTFGNMKFFGSFRATTFEEGLEFVVATLFMKNGAFGTQILVAYLIYLSIALPMLLSMKIRGAIPSILFVLFLYVTSQHFHETTKLPFAAFRHIAANSLLFLGGLIIGYYRNEIRGNAAVKKVRPVLDAAIILAGIVLMIGYNRDFVGFPAFLHPLAGNDLDLREFHMPPLHLAIVFLYLRFFIALVTYLWKPVNAVLGWFLLPLGQASLYTYFMHLLFLTLVRECARAIGDPGPTIALWLNIGYLGLIYLAVMVRRRVIHSEFNSTRDKDRQLQNILPKYFAFICLTAYLLVEFF